MVTLFGLHGYDCSLTMVCVESFSSFHGDCNDREHHTRTARNATVVGRILGILDQLMDFLFPVPRILTGILLYHFFKSITEAVAVEDYQPTSNPSYDCKFFLFLSRVKVNLFASTCNLTGTRVKERADVGRPFHP